MSEAEGSGTRGAIERARCAKDIKICPKSVHRFTGLYAQGACATVPLQRTLEAKNSSSSSDS